MGARERNPGRDNIWSIYACRPQIRSLFLKNTEEFKKKLAKLVRIPVKKVFLDIKHKK